MLVAEKQQTIMIFSNTSFVIKKRLIFFYDFSFLVLGLKPPGTSAKQQTESWYEGNKTYYEGKPCYSGATGHFTQVVKFTHYNLFGNKLMNNQKVESSSVLFL